MTIAPSASAVTATAFAPFPPRPANADGDIAGNLTRCADSTDDAEATGTTAAANGLRDDGRGIVASRRGCKLDVFIGDIADNRERYITCIATTVAGAADRNANRSSRFSTGRDTARHIEAAVATAASNRLRQDAGAAFSAGPGASVDGQRDVATIAATATGAAKADSDHASRFAAGRETGGNVESAGAATAAKRLSDNAVRAITERGYIAVDPRIHRASIAATGTGAAHADADRTGCNRCYRNRAGDIEPAGATAAAKRLGEEPGRIVSCRVDRSGTRVNVAGIAAALAGTPEAKRHRACGLATCDHTGNIEPTCTTTAADGLHDHTHRLVAIGEDGIPGNTGCIAAIAAVIAAAADAD